MLTNIQENENRRLRVKPTMTEILRRTEEPQRHPSLQLSRRMERMCKYYMKQIVLFVIILFFLTACTAGKYKRYSDSFDIKKSVELELVEYPDILGTAMQLLKKDSLILINDFSGDSLIHVFDVKNRQLIRKIVSVGNGPNELISPLEIQLTENNLYIFYRQASLLYSIPCSLIPEGSENMKKRFYVSPGANHLYPLSDSIFISSGFYQKRYALINMDGKIFKEFGEYPAYWAAENDIPVNARAMFHQTDFLRHPERQRFLTYSSHIIEIYDYLNPDAPVLVKDMLMEKYSYKYTNGEILSTDKGTDTERGIVCVASSHEYIYVVYDPNKSIHEGKGSQICIYDWDGNPIELLLFDKSISCLVIDEEEKRGYVIAEYPDDSLMCFNLYL